MHFPLIPMTASLLLTLMLLVYHVLTTWDSHPLKTNWFYLRLKTVVKAALFIGLLFLALKPELI